mmetsp:Transcript_9996/g.27337  ORF Transcript_9996/g.27337 Transcript_9996/m.27337 type:complete len:382 (-) Transcript_9996:196-1341(-)
MYQQSSATLKVLRQVHVDRWLFPPQTHLFGTFRFGTVAIAVIVVQHNDVLVQSVFIYILFPNHFEHRAHGEQGIVEEFVPDFVAHLAHDVIECKLVVIGAWSSLQVGSPPSDAANRSRSRPHDDETGIVRPRCVRLGIGGPEIVVAAHVRTRVLQHDGVQIDEQEPGGIHIERSDLVGDDVWIELSGHCRARDVPELVDQNGRAVAHHVPEAIPVRVTESSEAHPNIVEFGANVPGLLDVDQFGRQVLSVHGPIFCIEDDVGVSHRRTPVVAICAVWCVLVSLLGRRWAHTHLHAVDVPIQKVLAVAVVPGHHNPPMNVGIDAWAIQRILLSLLLLLSRSRLYGSMIRDRDRIRRWWHQDARIVSFQQRVVWQDGDDHQQR